MCLFYQMIQIENYKVLSHNIIIHKNDFQAQKVFLNVFTLHKTTYLFNYFYDSSNHSIIVNDTNIIF